MQFFQDYMPGNICFGCGAENDQGLQIRSYWEAEEALCEWQPEPKYQGWSGLLNGGIMATLIDCHCMGTAMAHAYKNENRALGSQPEYRYATGTLEIKYLMPTSSEVPLQLRAKVLEATAKKIVMSCELFSNAQKTVDARVVAIKVFDSSIVYDNNPFQ